MNRNNMVKESTAMIQELKSKGVTLELPENWNTKSKAIIEEAVYGPLKKAIAEVNKRLEETPPETPTPTIAPPEQPTRGVETFTFGGKTHDVTSGETITPEAEEEIEELSKKAGYIQGLAENRTGYPSEVKGLAKSLMKSKAIPTQQGCIANLIHEVMALLGYKWSNDAFKSKEAPLKVQDPPQLDTDWINWFVSGGAAQVGQFVRQQRA